MEKSPNGIGNQSKEELDLEREIRVGESYKYGCISLNLKIHKLKELWSNPKHEDDPGERAEGAGHREQGWDLLPSSFFIHTRAFFILYMFYVHNLGGSEVGRF